MKPTITIRPHNKKAHMAIMRDVLDQKNGLMTFVLRVSGGNIVQYTKLENKTYGRKTAQVPRNP